ncbi:hypothetical protein CYMTET_20125 [Cymbomonas tetramitiformis]|uniref:Uncharacterized protein n=1 Tax=Cymbomonas tetramitiformis TaxID=36881 RepID=A0AAE0L474_9CHLO|nr:hypothetical protein CYMTET_20125 [Cymbomonas tetramitiformis]
MQDVLQHAYTCIPIPCRIWQPKSDGSNLDSSLSNLQGKVIIKFLAENSDRCGELTVNQPWQAVIKDVPYKVPIDLGGVDPVLSYVPFIDNAYNLPGEYIIRLRRLLQGSAGPGEAGRKASRLVENMEGVRQEAENLRVAEGPGLSAGGLAFRGAEQGLARAGDVLGLGRRGQFDGSQQAGESLSAGAVGMGGMSHGNIQRLVSFPAFEARLEGRGGPASEARLEYADHVVVEALRSGGRGGLAPEARLLCAGGAVAGPPQAGGRLLEEAVDMGGTGTDWRWVREF